METQREAKRLCVFLCKVPSILKLPTFQQTTALQRKLSMRRVVARLCTGYCLLTLSFHFSFHDLRLDIGDWLQHSNHLIVLYAVTFVITFIPRLEASVFAELKQLWAICLTLHQHQFSPDFSKPA